MMKKKNFDITLYGHLSFDNIFNDFNYTTSVGCIGNVWKSLKNINPSLNIDIKPTALGESLILVNQKQIKRTSTSLLNLFKNKVNHIPSSQIHHIMYYNELEDVSFIDDIKSIGGFITADICNGKPLNVNCSFIKKIDLLFISDEDWNEEFNQLKDKIPHIILHSKNGSIYFENKNTHNFTAELVDDVNVLGMGDRFSAYVLCNILKNNFNIKQSIQPSHDLITYELKKQKI